MAEKVTKTKIQMPCFFLPDSTLVKVVIFIYIYIIESFSRSWDEATAWSLHVSLTNAWVRIPTGACEKVASDFGLDGSFPGYSGVLTTHNLLVTNYTQYDRKGNDGRISISKSHFTWGTGLRTLGPVRNLEKSTMCLNESLIYSYGIGGHQISKMWRKD